MLVCVFQVWMYFPGILSHSSGQQSLWSATHTVLLWESMLECKNANEVIDIIYA